MFDKITNTIKNKITTIKEEDIKYKQLLETTQILTELKPIQKINTENLIHKINFITNNCPDINEQKATTITNLIPLEETIIEAYYTKEIKTQKEYFIIPTNKYIWIINNNEYIILTYENNIEIIKNNLMSKVVLLNNILFEINGTSEKINKLILLIKNPQERKNIITEQTKYLCEINPIYQKINKYNCGISLDLENNIVIHNNEQSYKYHISQITNYELMLDNQIYCSKDSLSKTGILASKSSCLKMTLNLYINEQEKITLLLLDQNAFGTKYESTGSHYQESLNFGLTIINKIKELTTPQY